MADSFLIGPIFSSSSSNLKYINLSSRAPKSSMWENQFQNAKYGIFLALYRLQSHDFYAIAHCNVGESTEIQCNYEDGPNSAGVEARIELHPNYATAIRFGSSYYNIHGISAVIYYE